MQITSTQLQVLDKLRDNVTRTADEPPGVKLATLMILERRGLVVGKRGSLSATKPRSAIRWQIKPEGLLMLSTSGDRAGPY
jgi:hypothetical protein